MSEKIKLELNLDKWLLGGIDEFIKTPNPTIGQSAAMLRFAITSELKSQLGELIICDSCGTEKYSVGMTQIKLPYSHVKHDYCHKCLKKSLIETPISNKFTVDEQVELLLYLNDPEIYITIACSDDTNYDCIRSEAIAKLTNISLLELLLNHFEQNLNYDFIDDYIDTCEKRIEALKN